MTILTRILTRPLPLLLATGALAASGACVELDLDTDLDPDTEPAAIEAGGLLGPPALAVGDAAASCATKDGFVYCWGQNVGTVGQDNVFGIMAVDPSAIPMACKGGPWPPSPRNFCSKAVPISKWDPLTGQWSRFGGVTSVAVGNHHACAVVGESGKLFCWGTSTAMGFGDVDPADPYVVGGTARMCRTKNVKDDTGAYFPTIDGCRTPREVPLPAGMQAVRVVAHSQNTCAILKDTGDGETYAYCTGAMGASSYYLGFDPQRATPPEAGGLCSRAANGDITHCWTLVGVRRKVGASDTILTADKMSIHSKHACAIDNGSAWCWGYSGNNGSALGFGKPNLYPPGCGPHPQGWRDAYVCWYAKQVSNLAGATNIVAGYGTDACNPGQGHQPEVSCATTGGASYCWGADYHGMLGNGPNIGSTWLPSQVLNQAGRVITGSNGAMCLGNASGAYCWGEGWGGKRGDGTDVGYCSNDPDAIAQAPEDPVLAIGGGALTNVIAISGHGARTCAWAAGGLWCWGSHGAYASLGSGDNLPAACNQAGNNSYCIKAVPVVFTP